MGLISLIHNVFTINSQFVLQSESNHVVISAYAESDLMIVNAPAVLLMWCSMYSTVGWVLITWNEIKKFFPPICLMQGRIYMDYNATTPLEPEVIQAITEALQEAWGNPSSNYIAGEQ